MMKFILLLKVVLLISSIYFMYYLFNNWNEYYGTKKSIQFLFQMGLFGFVIICVILDFFSFFENFIVVMSENEAGIYFSSAIQILIGFVGIVAIVLSILYGVYTNSNTSDQEREKIKWQSKIWSIFSVYFIAFIIILFILPLVIQLGSFR